jgi:hypothetical protein
MTKIWQAIGTSTERFAMISDVLYYILAIQYDSYVHDFIIGQKVDGSEVVEFRDCRTKTQSGGLHIRQLKNGTPAYV